MNKKRMILLAMMLLIALSGCAGSGNSGKSLYEHGMDVIALMEEMVGSSSYGSLMSGAAEIEQMRQSLAAGDYAAPQAVYEIEVPTMGDISCLRGKRKRHRVFFGFSE